MWRKKLLFDQQNEIKEESFDFGEIEVSDQKRNARKIVNNISAENVFANSDVEISSQDLDILFDNIKASEKQISRRLNDYDSTIMEQKAHSSVKDESMNVEFKLQETEGELVKVEKQIKLLKMLDLEYDRTRLEQLEQKKLLLDKRYEELKKKYKSLGIMNNIADVLSDIFNKPSSKKQSQTAKESIEDVLSFVVPTIKKKQELKNKIQTLTMLEEKLIELSDLKKIPYGESQQSLKDFTALLNKANKITNKSQEARNFNKSSESSISFGLKETVKDLQDFYRIV